MIRLHVNSQSPWCLVRCGDISRDCSQDIGLFHKSCVHHQLCRLGLCGVDCETVHQDGGTRYRPERLRKILCYAKQLWLWLHCMCAWACEASLQRWINRGNFVSPLTRRRILPFRLTVGDMIYDSVCEYFTDPCKRNCFAEIWVERTLHLKIIHWDLPYDACQHPYDLMAKLCESQPKVTRKMQHWEVWTNNPFHNAYSKESSIFRQYIFLTIPFFSNTLDPWEWSLMKYW